MTTKRHGSTTTGKRGSQPAASSRNRLYLAIAGSLLGGRLATRVRPERLTATFIVLLVAVALHTAARSFPQLV